MNNGQFGAFVRFLLDALWDAKAEKDKVTHGEKMECILNNLQKALED